MRITAAFILILSCNFLSRCNQGFTGEGAVMHEICASDCKKAAQLCYSTMSVFAVPVLNSTSNGGSNIGSSEDLETSSSNDTFSEAQLKSLPTFRPNLLKGSISPANEYDIFLFASGSSGTYKVTLTSGSVNCDSFTGPYEFTNNTVNPSGNLTPKGIISSSGLTVNVSASEYFFLRCTSSTAGSYSILFQDLSNNTVNNSTNMFNTMNLMFLASSYMMCKDQKDLCLKGCNLFQ